MSRIVTINCGGEGKVKGKKGRELRETRLGVSWWLGLAPLLTPHLPGDNREVTGHPFTEVFHPPSSTFHHLSSPLHLILGIVWKFTICRFHDR